MRRLCYDRRLSQLVSSRSNEVSWLPEYTEYLLLLLLLHILILYFKYSMFWQPLFLFFMTYPDDFISSDFVNVPLEHTLDTTTKTVNSVADSSLWLVLLSNYRLWISCHIAELLWCFLTRINLYYQHSDAHSTSSPGDIFQLPHTLAKEIFICIISVIFYTDSVSKRWKMFWKVSLPPDALHISDISHLVKRKPSKLTFELELNKQIWSWSWSSRDHHSAWNHWTFSLPCLWRQN